MKVEINVPDSLSEIRLEQYQKFVKLYDGEVTEEFMALKMLEIFCGVKLNDAYNMRFKDVEGVTQLLSDILNEKPQLKRTFKMDGVEYGFIPNLDEMSFGEYIDLDTYLGDWQNIHKAMAVLYRPIKDKHGERYNIVPYEVIDAEVMRKMPLDAVIGSVLFLPFRDGLIESYDSLFGGTGGESYSAVSQFGQKWGWYQSIYALAQGDIRRFENITELGVHQCLTMLTFEKEKSEIEAQQMKSKFK